MKIKEWEKPEDGEETVVVCAYDTAPHHFIDDVKAKCAICGLAIKHRPHVPEPSMKMCIPCSFNIINEEEARGQKIEVCSTPEQRAEIENEFGSGSLEKGLKMMEELRKVAKREKGQTQ